MNYIVLSCSLWNLKSVGMRTNSFYHLIKYKLFACQGFIIPSLHLQVSSINQDPIVNVESSSYFNMKGTSFMVNTFEYFMHVVVHCSHSVEQFFCSGRAEFVLGIEVYGTWIKAIEASAWGEFVGSSGCSIVGKFCE